MTPLGICLAGPTASGKSALALQLADALHGEVEFISVDSAQVYRGMDIGTAKPDAAERARVPHHLIDLLEPEEVYSAALFVRNATAAAAAIRASGRLPLLVGGTMLYFKALRDGLDAMPAADPALRAQLDARAAVEGWPALHAELARVDPATAARLAPNDAQRIQRALEVWLATGRPLSAFHARGAASSDNSRWPLIALEPRSRAWLHQRIALRFDAMLAAGFVDEVRRLRKRPELRPQMPSMRCVGYRQAWAALDAGTLDGLREAGVAATRQLAKRQITWLRSMTDRHAIASDEFGAEARLLDAVRLQIDA
ncbi:MAG TPA: tRNA (adenosine(37)-N6)-dimethylallyltransferase MiaA [Rubrivivax sp.]|nr:tRNA (adenosine(37)-N6)-dimethylallyltransferase MiaA [Rubrivivax sp.]